MSDDKKIAEKRAQRLKACPQASQRGLMRAWSGKCSPRAAIKAFCLECVGYERAAVNECAAFACPLWAYRPLFGAK